jgi:hypothetical protein
MKNSELFWLAVAGLAAYGVYRYIKVGAALGRFATGQWTRPR